MCARVNPYKRFRGHTGVENLATESSIYEPFPALIVASAQAVSKRRATRPP